MLISNSLALSRSSVGSTVRSLDLAVDLTLILYVHRSLPYEPPLNPRAVQLTSKEVSVKLRGTDLKYLIQVGLLRLEQFLLPPT